MIHFIVSKTGATKIVNNYFDIDEAKNLINMLCDKLSFTIISQNDTKTVELVKLYESLADALEIIDELKMLK